jgi:hypothetical protein
MTNSILNTLILVVIAAIVAGAGYYMTEVTQPRELEKIENQAKEARLRYAKAEQLLAEQAATAGQAEDIIRKWKSRYKVIPQTMSTPDIVDYIEGLTRNGFESFSISLAGTNARQGVSWYSFDVTGVAYFRNFYELVWALENNRDFYHVKDVTVSATTKRDENKETGKQKQLDLVSFSMKLDAFFAGSEGLSAPNEERPPFSMSLLPARDPLDNSFYPVVRTDLPPNDRNLVDVENSKLISIIGNKAIFSDAVGTRELVEGDEVYLGRIVKVDPAKGMVRASLNRGGITDLVDVEIARDDNYYRQGAGKTRIDPIENQ